MLNLLYKVKYRFTKFRRKLCRISASQLEQTLSKTIGATKPEILFVHSSLSRCGYLEPGAEGLINALRQQCNTLCLPTHTYCYTQDGETPIYDPKSTRSIIGTVTNTFWKMPNVLRSVHPTHSLAASGPIAEELCRDHVACNTACGPDTPYARMILQDASVLMFGATMNTYTLFHCSEHDAECSYLYSDQAYTLKSRDHDGQIHELPFRRQDMSIPRRFDKMREELRDEGLLSITPLGCNELLFIPSCKSVHEYTMNRLKADELHLVDPATAQLMRQP